MRLLGKLSISPWYTAILDLAILTVLVQSYVETLATLPSVSTRPLRFLAVVAAFGVPVGFIMAGATVVRLTVLPPGIDLGTVSQGGYTASELVLRNPHQVVVQVKQVESSCDCLAVEPSTLRLEPGQQARVLLTLDLRKEPNFVGTLAMNAVGRAPDGRVAFRVACHARVSPSELALVEIDAFQPFNEEVLR